jgi:hypothetical protein
MATPTVHSRTLALPKAGAGPDAYEDAAQVRAEAWPVRAAVADGATESVFAGTWAEILVGAGTGEALTTDRLREGLPDWQRAWAARCDAQAAAAPWYVRAKADEGAFATLLGLEVCADGRWRAAAVGDCVLFHLRDGALRASWPIHSLDAFGNRPALLPSRPSADASGMDALRTTSGPWTPGDVFLLTTDAVGAGLLRGAQSPEAPFRPAAAADWSAAAFREAVATARAEGALRNDDSTLLVLDLSPSGPPVSR